MINILMKFSKPKVCIPLLQTPGKSIIAIYITENLKKFLEIYFFHPDIELNISRNFCNRVLVSELRIK